MPDTPLIEVRRATPADLPYVSHLQKRYPRDLGFLPTEALDTYIRANHVSIGLLNGDPACYLLGRGPTAKLPDGGQVVQAAVQYDARHRTLGTALVHHFVSSMPAWAAHLYLWCAQDIEAGLFWQTQGFTPKAWRLGGKATGRIHILWHRQLDVAVNAPQFIIPRMSMCGSFRESRIVTQLHDGEPWQTCGASGLVGSALKPVRLPRVARVKRPTIVVPEGPYVTVLMSGRLVRRPAVAPEVSRLVGVT